MRMMRMVNGSENRLVGGHGERVEWTYGVQATVVRRREAVGGAVVASHARQARRREGRLSAYEP